MSFISELERLKQAATNEFLEDRALPKLAFYLADHADEIAELVKAAGDIAENEPFNETYRMRVLREALANLNKEKS